MKLTALKEKTYSIWLIDRILDDPDYPDLSETTDEAFKRSIRSRYGDLRRKQTWEAAFIDIKANSLYEHNDDSRKLVELDFIQTPKQEGYFSYVPKILEKFILINRGMESIAISLIQTLEQGLQYIDRAEILEFLHIGRTVARQLNQEQALAPVCRLLAPAAA